MNENLETTPQGKSQEKNSTKKENPQIDSTKKEVVVLCSHVISSDQNEIEPDENGMYPVPSPS